MRGGSTFTNTFIEVAPDCPALTGVPPQGRGGRPTLAQLEFELLRASPYAFTHEELILEIQVRRRGLEGEDREAVRAEVFAKPQACLRASPLPKTYGWGVHFDEHGKIAIYPRHAAEYRRFVENAAGQLTVLRAMRSRRAR